MPKDNEVDEKAQTEELIGRLREVLGANGSGPGTTLLARAQYHAATVAELRARIDRLAELRANDAAYIKKLDGIIEETGARPVSCINPYEDLKAVVLALKKRADEADAAERRVGELERLRAETYQVVSVLLSDTGQFDSDHGQKILDNLSEARIVHEDVLPWATITGADPT